MDFAASVDCSDSFPRFLLTSAYYHNLKYFDIVPELYPICFDRRNGVGRFSQRCTRLESLSIMGRTFDSTAFTQLIVGNRQSLRRFACAETIALPLEASALLLNNLTVGTLETIKIGAMVAPTALREFLSSQHLPSLRTLFVPAECLHPDEMFDRTLQRVRPNLTSFGFYSSFTNSANAVKCTLAIGNCHQLPNLRSIYFGVNKTVPPSWWKNFLLPDPQKNRTSGDLTATLLLWKTEILSQLRKGFEITDLYFSGSSLFEVGLQYHDTGLELPALKSFLELMRVYHNGILSAENTTLLSALVWHLKASYLSLSPKLGEYFRYIVQCLEEIPGLSQSHASLLMDVAYFASYGHSTFGSEDRVLEILIRALPNPHVGLMQRSLPMLGLLLRKETYLSSRNTISFNAVQSWPYIRSGHALLILSCPKTDPFMTFGRGSKQLLEWWVLRRRGIRAVTFADYELNLLSDVFIAQHTKLQNQRLTDKLLVYSPFYKRMVSHSKLLMAFASCFTDSDRLLQPRFLKYLIATRNLSVLLTMAKLDALPERWTSQIWDAAVLLKFKDAQSAASVLSYVDCLCPEWPQWLSDLAADRKRYPLGGAAKRELIQAALALVR